MTDHQTDNQTDNRATEPDAALDPRDAAVRALRRSLTHPFRWGLLLGLALAVVAALLIIQNGESARINWLWMNFSAPLWLVLLLATVSGGFIWEALRIAVRRGRAVRAERRTALEGLRSDAP